MIGTYLLYLIPVVVQLAAAALALRLIATTGRRLAWVLLALAFIVMAVRRAVEFAAVAGWVEGEPGSTFDLVLATLISLLTLVGVVRMSQLFRQAREDAASSERAAVQLSSSEKRYRSLLNRLPEAVVAVRDGEIIYANRTFARLFQVRPENVRGRSLESFLGVDRGTQASQLQVREDDTTASGRLQFAVDLPSGERRVIALRGHNVEWEGADALVAIISDLTEQERASEELREKERTLSTLLSNLPGVAYRCQNDREWTMEFVSEGCLVLTGYQPADLVGNQRLSWNDLIHPDDREMVWRDVQAALAEHRPYRMSYRIKTSSGGEKWVWEQGRGVSTPEGDLIALEGLIMDISERKQAEEALAESEERFRSIFNSVAIGLYRTTPDGQVLMANPALISMLRYPSFEALASRNLESEPMYLPPDRTSFRALVESEGGVRGLEGTLVAYDGTAVFVRETARASRDQNGKVQYYEGTIEDISERRRLEEELRHAQKMETMGRLAGGIAHDINNLLVPIIGGAELLQRRLAGDAEAMRELDTTLRTAKRAAQLTRKLLAFARRQVLQPIPLDLNQVVGGMMQMLRRLIPESIAIHFVPGGALRAVEADPGQLEQIIVNLFTNAADAMPGGGAITVTTENQPAHCRPPLDQLGNVADGYVTLTIADTGVGMSESTLARAFEPFFTTKEPGRGTGLGLATVYGIVKQHGGTVDAASEPGKGSSFRIWFPASQRPIEVAPPPVSGPVRGGTESILVVEDEAEVRSLLVEVLRGLGYAVAEASDGAEALAYIRAHLHEIDLLLTDVVMPRMSGVELCREVARIAPDVAFLLSSGYSESAVPDEVAGERPVAFLAKPYGIDELGRTVRDLLDRRPQRPRPE